jgi:hypothetical protein
MAADNGLSSSRTPSLTWQSPKKCIMIMKKTVTLMGRMFTAAVMLFMSQNMMATAFTNVYVKADVATSGAGTVYITSDDPAPTAGSVEGETTEAQFTTGSDGDYSWTDADGTAHKNSRYWAVVHVTPAAGYTCVGLVKAIHDSGVYADADYYTGYDAANTAPTDADKDAPIKSVSESGMKVNVNWNGTYSEITNSNNFSNAEEARTAAKASPFPETPTQIFAIFTSADGVGKVVAEKVSVDGPAFNVAGQRVGDSYKGIVIRNGKKVIRK